MKANSPTLIATITQLLSALSNWKSQAEKYCHQLQHGYALDKQLGGKFQARLDALASTYHQRIFQLQAVLSEIKAHAATAGNDGKSVANALEAVCNQFDKVDPYVSRLEGDIQKIAVVSQYAAKLDAIFQPLQWMLKHYKCVGDQDDIKAMTWKTFQLLSQLSGIL